MWFVDRVAANLGFERKESAIPTDTDFSGIGGTANPTQILGTFDDTVAVYQSYPWVYACVRAIAEAGAKIPIFVHPLDDSGMPDTAVRLQPEDFPNVGVLSNPNPLMSPQDLTESLLSWLALTGNSYAELVRDPDDEESILEIFPVMSQKMSIVPNERRGIEGYIFNADSRQSIPLAPSQIMHSKLFHPNDDFYGHPPVLSVGHAVLTDLHAIEYNKNFFVNSARPGGVLETDRSLSARAFRRVLRQWNAVHRGGARAHRTALLEEGLKWKQAQLTPQDLEFLNSRKMSKAEILAAYRVPPVILSDVERAAFANVTLQRRIFVENAVLPMLCKIVYTLNRVLFPRTPIRRGLKMPQAVAVLDRATIDEMTLDRKEQSMILTRYVQMGVMTINEARNQLGMAPVPWGDTWFSTNTSNPVASVDQGVIPVKEDSVDTPEAAMLEYLLTEKNPDLLYGFRVLEDSVKRLAINGSGRPLPE